MDCPAEAQLIRLCLAEAPVAAMDFDFGTRQLRVDHAGDIRALVAMLSPLGLGAELLDSRPLEAGEAVAKSADAVAERRVLLQLLGINAALFVIELGAGWWAGSAGLVADAADMLADALVYAVALYAVGRGLGAQRTAARLAGLLQLGLGLAALAEALRGVLTGRMPEETTMIGISLLALAANLACLWLLTRHRGGGAHMRASTIFSANDVLANLGVIAAGGAVAWTGQAWPDWLVGGLIGALVLVGAIRILRLR